MPSTGIAHAPPRGRLADFVHALRRAWRTGAQPDAVGALRQHPELLAHRSLVVDLAYEEFCLRHEAGTAPDPDAFCRCLPAFQSHIRQVLREHLQIADHPEWFPAPDTVWPEPGARFAGLSLVEELGRGAFARVYLARDPDTGDKPVVLKLSRAGSEEARTLGPVRHPHVVGVHWARKAGDLFAICLPFVGAATLRDVVDAAFHPASGRRSARTILQAIDSAAAPFLDAPDPVAPLLDPRRSYPEAVAAVFARLAGALAHLHRLGVGHGDLKPSNVLLGPGGHPYLIDFNLAGGPADPALRCGGTLPYMAPERLRVHLGASTDPGPSDKADVYSFGVVLFEALTGRLPYDPPFGLDPPAAAADLLRQSAAGPVRPVGVPRPLTRLVERCLAADPASRPAAADIDRALSRYMRRRVRRNRMAVAGVALMVVALAGWRLTVSGRESAALAGPAAVAPHSPPTTPDELFARGLEYLRVGDIAPAMADFGAAYGDRPDGRTAAYFAYCLAKSGNNAAAAELYKEAVQKHGYDAAWVRCNRAASLLQLGSPAQIRLAGDEAAAAIQLDPNLAPARLTRAWIRYLDARRQFPSGGAGPDGQALADIGVALRLGYSNADVHYKAALIVLMFGIAKEDARAEAVRHLAEAVSLGRNPRTLIVDRFLSAQLADRSDFRDLERLTPGFAPAFIDPHLASPPD